MDSELFLDTAFAIALASPADSLHRQAVRLAEHIQTTKSRLVTTQAVILEIGNALAKQRYRAASIQLLHSLQRDPSVTIEALSEELAAQGYSSYEARPDKEWSLTDCISFIVMQDRSLTDALTSDEHFEQAGFRALLRH